jgi:hypothetical protein
MVDAGNDFDLYLRQAIAWREQRPLYSGTNPDLCAGFLVKVVQQYFMEALP